MPEDKPGDGAADRTPSEPDAPVTSQSIDGLRARLTSARAQRGACPPFAELQKDLLPSRAARPGREERLSHLERCSVCSHRTRSWQTSWEGRAAYLAAAARAGGGHLAGGTGSALSEVAKRVPRRRPKKSKLPPLPPELQVLEPSVPAPRAAEPPPPARRAAEPQPPAPRAAEPPPPAPRAAQRPAPRPPARPATARPQASTEYWADPATAAEPQPARSSPRLPRFAKQSKPAALPPLLVFEAPPPGVVPAALLDTITARGGAVVAVDSVEEIFRDPDFRSVRGIVLARARPLAEWPTVLASMRLRAPGRALLAIVSAPRFGPAAVSWAHDPAILIPPVSEKHWDPALHRAGWLSPA